MLREKSEGFTLTCSAGATPQMWYGAGVVLKVHTASGFTLPDGARWVPWGVSAYPMRLPVPSVQAGPHRRFPNSGCFC
jgi:hypothetical protein